MYLGYSVRDLKNLMDEMENHMSLHPNMLYIYGRYCFPHEFLHICSGPKTSHFPFLDSHSFEVSKMDISSNEIPNAKGC